MHHFPVCSFLCMAACEIQSVLDVVGVGRLKQETGGSLKGGGRVFAAYIWVLCWHLANPGCGKGALQRQRLDTVEQ